MQITPMPCPTHEEVWRISDAGSGLHALIAIHSTARGPAAGGLRMQPYDSEDAALHDVLRLSRGMTYKCAAAGLPLGGGKAVILGDPRTGKTPALLRAFGRAVESLEGRYTTAEDMGLTPDDMAVIRTETARVAGLASGAHASGDPSPITAEGILAAIRITARHRFGPSVLSGRRVAVQGLGNVGWQLVKKLKAAGADVVVADLDPDRADRAAASFAVDTVPPEAILGVEADILAPCAIGGILDARTIRALRVRAVAGGANNQLATPEDGDRLHRAGILYAPDYVANGGGIISVAAEILRIADREAFVQEKLSHLGTTLEAILTRAAATGRSPARLADELVEATMLGSAA